MFTLVTVSCLLGIKSDEMTTQKQCICKFWGQHTHFCRRKVLFIQNQANIKIHKNHYLTKQKLQLICWAMAVDVVIFCDHSCSLHQHAHRFWEKCSSFSLYPPNEELEGTLHPQKFGCTPNNEGKRVHVPPDEKTCGHAANWQIVDMLKRNKVF
jgi:hypothetical protein